MSQAKPASASTPGTVSAPADGYSRHSGSEIPARSGAELIRQILDSTYRGCEEGCLHCGNSNEAAAELKKVISEIAETWKVRARGHEAYANCEFINDISRTGHSVMAAVFNRVIADFWGIMGGAEPAGALHSTGTQTPERPAGNAKGEAQPPAKNP